MSRGEGIKKLSNLFDRYKDRLIAPERSVKVGFVEVVRDLYGWEVREDQLAYSPGSQTLTVRVGGPLRNEVLLNKDEILIHLKGRLGVRSAPKNIL